MGTLDRSVLLAAGVGATGLLLWAWLKRDEKEEVVEEPTTLTLVPPLEPVVVAGGMTETTLNGRPAAVLYPDPLVPTAGITIVFHTGKGKKNLVSNIAKAARGKHNFDVTTVSGAANQATALEARAVLAKGNVVFLPSAGIGQSWTAKDISYLQSAVPTIQSLSGVSGKVALSSGSVGTALGRKAYEYLASNYGWTAPFSMAVLTPTSTGLPNQPSDREKESNLSKLSDFLARIPIPFRVNSGYRSPEVNVAIAGSKTSQHMNGLAADISPTTMTNKELATWFYEYREDFPELDQVIWYTDTRHVHVGICPSGASGCASKAPRGEFFWSSKEGGVYTPWAPTLAEKVAMAATIAAHRPLRTAGALVGIWVTGALALSVVGLAIAWKYRDQLRR